MNSKKIALLLIFLSCFSYFSIYIHRYTAKSCIIAAGKAYFCSTTQIPFGLLTLLQEFNAKNKGTE